MNKKQFILSIVISIGLISLIIFNLSQFNQQSNSNPNPITVNYFSLSCDQLKYTINLALNSSWNQFAFAQSLIGIMQMKGCQIQ